MPTTKLTPKEIAVRNLIIHKRSTAEIAKAMGVNASTVYVHVSRIRAKLPGFHPPHVSTRGTTDTEATPRQRHILGMMGQGMSHKQIAETLGIKEQSVANAVYNARKRRGEVRHPRPIVPVTWEDDPLMQ